MQIRNVTALALIFVFLYNLLFFKIDLGIGLGLQYLLLNLFFFLTRHKETKNLDYAVASSAVAASFAFLYGFRGNEIIQLIDNVQALMFSVAALFFYKYPERFSLTLPNFLLIPLTSVLKILSTLFGLLGQTEEGASEKPKNELTPAILRGVLFSILLVGILLLLLTQGDMVFGKIVGDFFSTIWERIIFSAVVFVILASLGMTKIKDHLSLFSSEVKLGVGKFHEIIIILGSLVGLFTIFITIQFRYLFLPVGETELRQIGINSATYSEYVRAGFTEILVAATIVLAVIIYISRFTHVLADKQKNLIQLLTSILIIENGLILLSDTKRLFLYADAHGLTRAREFGFAFLIWLAAILVILLWGVLKRMEKDYQAKLTLSITLLILFAINIINLDGVMAMQYKPTVNNEVDYTYLTNLSADGYEAWMPAIKDADELLKELNSRTDLSSDDYRKFTYARMSMENLSRNHIQPLLDKYSYESKWQSFNFSEYLAYRHIKDNDEEFSDVPRLLDEAKTLDQRFHQSTKDETQLDRSTDTPLTTN